MRFAFLRLPICCLQLFVVTLFFGCSKPAPIAGFNSQAWKNDPHGCSGARAEIWQQFEGRKSELRGYNENDLTHLLGKAESSRLLERGQKMYFYHIAGSPKCENKTGGDLVQLQVRVNAVGKVSEVEVIK